MATASKRAKASFFERLMTRSNSQYYLIGQLCESLTGSKLPTTRQVLQYILCLKEIASSNTPINVFIKQAVEEVLPFWNMAGIKTIQQQNAEKKLQNIWQNWMNLKKYKNRQTKKNQSEEKLTDLTDNLWDIGASDAIAAIQSNRFLSEAKKQDDIRFGSNRSRSFCILQQRFNVINIFRTKRF